MNDACRNDVDMVESWRLRQLPRRHTLATFPVGADGGNPLPHARQLSQCLGRCVVQRQNPTLAALQVLACADERSKTSPACRLPRQKRITFLRVEYVAAPVDGLGADDQSAHAVDRRTFLPNHQMSIRQPAPWHPFQHLGAHANQFPSVSTS